MTTPQLPSREEVVALCARLGYKTNGFAYNSQIWIKYGPGATLAEATTQQFVRNNADRRVVYIPEVYDSFSSTPPGMPEITYIVMEKVEGEDYVDYIKQHPEEADTVLQAIASTVRHIWSLPIPPNTSPGPFGGQIPVDRFFSDYSAGRTFRDLAQLEGWINGKLIAVNRPERVDFSSQQLGLRHLDLTQYNILVTKPITIIDWGFSGIYPVAFEEYVSPWYKYHISVFILPRYILPIIVLLQCY